MNKEHKIYTEDEVRSFYKKDKIIKYTVINPLNDYEEYFYHDCNIAGVALTDGILTTRYQSNSGVCDYNFRLNSIANIENITHENFIYEVAPSD